jgi:hypothetical protein
MQDEAAGFDRDKQIAALTTSTFVTKTSYDTGSIIRLHSPLSGMELPDV